MHGSPRRATNASKSTVVEAQQAPETMLLIETPPPPETLDENGRFWWEYYCGLFIEAKILSRMYVASISNLCHILQIINALEQKIQENGIFTLTVKKFQGQEYTDETINPMLKDLKLYYDSFDKLANSLGLTPYASKINSIDTTGDTSATSAPQPPPIPSTLKITG